MAEPATTVNDHLILVVGESSAGKSASLMNLKNPEGVIYLNCESGKKLPFKAKFQQFTITEPYQVIEAFQAHKSGKLKAHTLVTDTLTFLLDMYESQYIIGASDGRAAWGNFQQFFKEIMQTHVPEADMNVAFFAHSRADYDEAKMEMKVAVPVKGALKNNGIEAYFSHVIAAKRMSISKLEDYRENNKLLTITPREEMLGYKHVFQTQVTKETVGERIRGPMGMWSHEETYIDNDLQLVFDRLHEYYD